MTLNQLLKIKQDNYLGLNGKDYCPFEVETRIIEIMNKQAAASKYQPQEWNELVGSGSQAPAVKQTINFKLKTTKPMFVVNMANEKAA